MSSEEGTKLIDLGLDDDSIPADFATETTTSTGEIEQDDEDLVDRRVKFNNNVDIRYMDSSEAPVSVSRPSSSSSSRSSKRSSSSSSSSKYPAPLPGASTEERSLLHKPLYEVQIVDIISYGLAIIAAFNIHRFPNLDRIPESWGVWARIFILYLVVRLLFYVAELILSNVSSWSSSFFQKSSSSSSSSRSTRRSSTRSSR